MAHWNIDPFKDYYAVLGVLADAELVVIHAAFRALAMRYHPDTYRGDRFFAEARMRELNEAHEILSNEHTRSRYDTLRKDGSDDTGERSPTSSRHTDPSKKSKSAADSNIRKSSLGSSPVWNGVGVGALGFGLVLTAILILSGVGRSPSQTPPILATANEAEGTSPAATRAPVAKQITTAGVSIPVSTSEQFPSPNQSAMGGVIDVTNLIWESQKGSLGALEYRFTIRNKTTKPIFAIKYVVDFSDPYDVLYSEVKYAPNAILGNERRVLYNTTYLPWDTRNRVIKIGIRVLAYEFLQNWDEARRR